MAQAQQHDDFKYPDITPYHVQPIGGHPVPLRAPGQMMVDDADRPVGRVLPDCSLPCFWTATAICIIQAAYQNKTGTDDFLHRRHGLRV